MDANHAARVALGEEALARFVNEGWFPLWGFQDPPPPPEGYDLELDYGNFLGFAIAYRFVVNEDKEAQAVIEGRLCPSH